jgi:hypothetical protein
MTRTEDSNNYYIYCGKCNTLLGCELKNIPDEVEPEINNNSIYEYNYYLLKKNIKERKNRTISINLISFKENLLKTINTELNNIFKELSNVHIQINITPLTKQNYEDFSKFYKKNQFDFTFVVHKMEGRIFLLGNNGYFNGVENCLMKKQNSNLYFILISNEVDERENRKIIEELIYKGGEERLEKYYKNDRIIFLDNYEIQKDINDKKKWFINKIQDIFGNNNNYNKYFNDNNINNTDKYYMQSERNLYVADKRKIDNIIEYLNNKEKRGHSGCFS